MYSYPNPCDTCEKECVYTRGCDAWKIRMLTIWKQFNGYMKRQRRKGKKVETFVYEHPDLLRKYLRDGPCKGCKLEKDCDNACGSYGDWWDARIEWLKFIWGIKNEH